MNATEKIPLKRLKLLNRLSLDSYISLIGKTTHKKCEIKEHYKLIKTYIKDMIPAKGEMKKFINTVKKVINIDFMVQFLFKPSMQLNTVKQVIKKDFMVQILFKPSMQLFVDIYLGDTQLMLIK